MTNQHANHALAGLGYLLLHSAESGATITTTLREVAQATGPLVTSPEDPGVLALLDASPEVQANATSQAAAVVAAELPLAPASTPEPAPEPYEAAATMAPEGLPAVAGPTESTGLPLSAPSGDAAPDAATRRPIDVDTDEPFSFARFIDLDSPVASVPAAPADQATVDAGRPALADTAIVEAVEPAGLAGEHPKWVAVDQAGENPDEDVVEDDASASSTTPLEVVEQLEEHASHAPWVAQATDEPAAEDPDVSAVPLAPLAETAQPESSDAQSGYRPAGGTALSEVAYLG